MLSFIVSACQTTEHTSSVGEKSITVSPLATTVIGNSENTTIQNTQLRTVVVQRPLESSQQVLKVLRVTDGSGCPDRDPISYGVFLRSETSGGDLVCYYN